MENVNHRAPKDVPQKLRIGKMRWFWLSFISEEKWLGACCVEGVDISDCVKIARTAGCNPGGGVMAVALHDGVTPPPALQYKLITDEHMCELLVGELVNVDPTGHKCVECEKEEHG